MSHLVTTCDPCYNTAYEIATHPAAVAAAYADRQPRRTNARADRADRVRADRRRGGARDRIGRPVPPKEKARINKFLRVCGCSALAFAQEIETLSRLLEREAEEKICQGGFQTFEWNFQTFEWNLNNKETRLRLILRSVVSFLMASKFCLIEVFYIVYSILECIRWPV